MSDSAKQELIDFLKNSADTSGWRYLIEETETGFTVTYDTSDKDYLKTAEVPESFKFTVELDSASKTYFFETTTIYSLDPDTKEVNDELEHFEAEGSIESNEILLNDEWRIVKAERWLTSMLEFKEYSSKKKTAKQIRRIAITVVSIIALGLVLGLLIFGAKSLSNGGLDFGFSNVDLLDISDEQSGSPDETVQSFFN